MTIRESYPLEDSFLIKELMDTMSKLTDMIMNKQINYNYIFEIRDCIIWSLNLLNEFITIPSKLFLFIFLYFS